MKTLVLPLLMLSFDASPQTVWATTNAGGVVTCIYSNAAASPTSAAIYASALASGISVMSTATPALNATYSATMAAQSNVTGVVTSLGTDQGPSNAASIINWLDAVSASRTFTAVQIMTLIDAIRNYVYALHITAAKPDANRTTTRPPPSVTIPQYGRKFR